MERKNLLLVGGLIGVTIVLLIGIVVSILPTANIFIANFPGEKTFDNSTPEATAISIARLNLGQWGFDSATIKSVHLTSDSKYWVVEIYNSVYQDGFDVVTVDAKTWASKINSSYEPNLSYTWRSLDELKAIYIAEIQARESFGQVSENEEPQKITIDGKEIWKIPVHSEYSQENGLSERDKYIYVDVVTGKSKNTFDEFNDAAGTDSWLTLKQVDDTINKMVREEDSSVGVETAWTFRNALRDLYPE